MLIHLNVTCFSAGGRMPSPVPSGSSMLLIPLYLF